MTKWDYDVSQNFNILTQVTPLVKSTKTKPELAIKNRLIYPVTDDPENWECAMKWSVKKTGGYFDQLTSPAACEQEPLTMSLTISPPVTRQHV